MCMSIMSAACVDMCLLDCIAHAAEGTQSLDRWTKEGATALLFWD